jgi:hypothetical protein
MDHPSEEWKEWNEEEGGYFLSKIDKRIFNRDIRFENIELGNKSDHDKCFRWEYLRTRIFKGEKITSPIPDQEFPYYVKTFPRKAYLSHRKKTRQAWKLILGAETFDHDECLFLDSSGTEEVIKELGTKLPATKVPLTMHVSPYWPRDKFKELVRKQLDLIYLHIDLSKKKMESDGRSIQPKESNHLSTKITKLKYLGHYRLNQCVNLSWAETMDSYGSGYYKSESDFRTDVKKNLHYLPLR